MYSKWYEITLQQFLSDRCTKVISCQIERFFQSEKSSDKIKNKVVIPEATPTFCILVRINNDAVWKGESGINK